MGLCSWLWVHMAPTVEETELPGDSHTSLQWEVVGAGKANCG